MTGLFHVTITSMSSVDVLKQTETAIAALSERDRKKLFKKFSLYANAGVERKKGVMGGAACVRGTRIPVWLLYQARQLGLGEGDLLKSYPGLTAEDLVNAWKYAEAHPAEIAADIRDNERED